VIYLDFFLNISFDKVEGGKFLGPTGNILPLTQI
jgi:hypothetical protein